MKRLIAGRYERVHRIAQGGMAETWLGRRCGQGLDQRVCLKVLLGGFAGDPEYRRCLQREASIASRLRHSNIVSLIDVDLEASCLVLELVEGTDLRTLLNAVPNQRLSVDLTTLIAIELCKALRYAHSRQYSERPAGIVHRDVSAANVLVSYYGEIKLADFGVAAVMSSNGEPFTTAIRGKLPYMSPEQARGDELDGRSDLFALGVLCYELLAGRRPFDRYGDPQIPLATSYRIAIGQYKPLSSIAPDVPAPLVSIIERLLHPDRDERYEDAGQCLDALSALAPSPGVTRELEALVQRYKPYETIVEPTPDHPAREERLRVPQRRLLAFASAIGLLAVGTLTPWMASLREPPREARALAMPAPEAAMVASVDEVQSPERPTAAERQEPAPTALTAPLVTDTAREGANDRELVPVRIGSLPPSQLWVDGRAIGDSPLTVKLTVGSHRFGAGSPQAEVSREVRVVAGRANGIYLRLPQ